MYYLDFKEYVTKDWWNISDFILFALYAAFLPISFLYTADEYIFQILQCLIVMFLTIKINFFLRIFDRFSFLVQMILAVFKDLQHFLLYFCIILSAFSIQISIIQKDVDGHEGIGSFKYFVMTLRTSIGDNDISEEFSEFKILFWIIWASIVFIGNIVLMNFIIAVVNESYNQCMATNEAQSFKVKVDMIVEYESTMSVKEQQSQHAFPAYILVRKAVETNHGLADGD
jgi:Ion transport protein